jgi:hypothetical protein
MGIIGVIFGILGCRVMHFVHHRGDEVKSGALSVGDVVTATSGGEILGGIVLAVASVIVYLRVRGKPIRGYLDIAFPPHAAGDGDRAGGLFSVRMLLGWCLRNSPRREGAALGGAFSLWQSRLRA